LVLPACGSAHCLCTCRSAGFTCHCRTGFWFYMPAPARLPGSCLPRRLLPRAPRHAAAPACLPAVRHLVFVYCCRLRVTCTACRLPHLPFLTVHYLPFLVACHAPPPCLVLDAACWFLLPACTPCRVACHRLHTAHCCRALHCAPDALPFACPAVLHCITRALYLPALCRLPFVRVTCVLPHTCLPVPAAGSPPATCRLLLVRTLYLPACLPVPHLRVHIRYTCSTFDLCDTYIDSHTTTCYSTIPDTGKYHYR